MITIDSLTVRYGPQTVLDNLTMHLSERSVHGLVGVNGAGKTTLFDTFFGLVTPDSGSITHSGHPLRRSEIAYLESETFFYDGIEVADSEELHTGSMKQECSYTLNLDSKAQLDWTADQMTKQTEASSLLDEENTAAEREAED